MGDTRLLDISVVIPVYKSRDCLPELLRQLTGQLEFIGRSHEIILVDDASPDTTWSIILELTQKYRQLRAVQLMKNRGQAFATLCGFAHARGSIVVTMDDDLQHRPDQLPRLLEALEANLELDCVFGWFGEKQHTAYRNIGSNVMRWVTRRAFGLPKGFRSSTFRAMRRSLVRAILEHHTANPAIAVLVFSSTARLCSVPVEHAARYAGKSTYTLAKQVRLALDGICNVSMLPLRALSYSGIAACILSLFLVANFAYRYIMGYIGVAGWTTVVILISFFSGTILLSLGIIGEYMVRILREVRGAPAFVERERIGFDTAKVLVIGAGHFQVPLIEKARELGYMVCATSNRKDDPGLRVADKGYPISILDFPALVRVCREEGISAVVTGASDLGTLAVGYLNDRLGMYGLTEEQARSVSDKGMFLQLQARLGLPRPQSFEVTSRIEMEEALSRLSSFPVILKPLQASGSRGLHLAQHAEEVRQFHDHVSQQSFSRKGYLLQTFVEGVEHGAECLIENGKVVFLQMTHKFLNPLHVPIGHLVPFDPDAVIRRSLIEQVEKIAGHLRVRNSPVNMDVFINAQGVPVLVDFSFRFGGNLLPQLMREKFGIDIIKRSLEYCLPGDLPTLARHPQSEGYYGAVIFGSPDPMVFTEEVRRQTIECFHQSSRVIDLVFDVLPGEQIQVFDQGSHRFGHALIEIASIDTYRNILDSHQRIISPKRFASEGGE